VGGKSRRGTPGRRVFWGKTSEGKGKTKDNFMVAGKWLTNNPEKAKRKEQRSKALGYSEGGSGKGAF